MTFCFKESLLHSAKRECICFTFHCATFLFLNCQNLNKDKQIKTTSEKKKKELLNKIKANCKALSLKISVNILVDSSHFALFSDKYR